MEVIIIYDNRGGFGIPIGLAVLSVSPQATLKIIISCFIFLMTSILLGGVTYKGTLTKSILTLTGIVAALFNGITASGGLVAATFLASAAFPVRNVRATMVVFILIMDIIFILGSTMTAVYNEKIFNTFFLSCIPMFLGIAIGIKLFGYLDKKKLRLLILLALSLLSIIGLLKAINT